MTDGFKTWYTTKQEALDHARELGYALFGNDHPRLMVGNVFAAKTYGAVGHAAGVRDQLWTLVVHRNTGYADWRRVPEFRPAEKN